MRITTVLGTLGIAALCALGGCEKDSGLPSKTSGKLRAQESAMLELLPGGNVAIFGGNYMKLQSFFQTSPVAKMMGAVEEVVPGTNAWNSCFLEGDASKLQILGVVAYADDLATMTFVMRGFSVPQVEACAKKASFPSTVDADGKFVAVEVPTLAGTSTTGYLVLADGTLLSSQAMPFPPGDGGGMTRSGRADLEAVAASAARRNAAADATLLDEATRIDRDRAVWFVADLRGTPAGEKVGLMRGWIDVGGGIDVDLSVQITDRATADEVAEGLPKLKGQADMLGKDVAEVVRAIRYERKGDRFRFGLKVSNRQLEKLASSMGGMLGGRGGF